MLNQEQYNEVKELYHKYLTEYPYWRYGQSVFNALYELYPEVANSIRGTEFDPFYKDELIGPMFEQILEEGVER